MSLSQRLSEATLDTICNSLKVGGTYSSELTSAIDGSVIGAHLVLEGDGIAVVNVGITVPAFGLDSHMIFAFTSPDSAVPHFTLDSVLAGPHYAFHLDLIPRLDPGANLAYLDHCYVPLDPAVEAAERLEGLTPAHLSRRQWQLMSAWMLAHRADETGFVGITPVVKAYLDHWLKLVREGVPDQLIGDVTSAELSERDRRNRAALFNPDVDPVWARMDQLLGADVSLSIRDSLREAGREQR